MGVEIFQFGLPAEFPPLARILDGTLNGQIVQSIGQLIQSLRDGESGEEFLADLGPPYSDEELAAIRCAYESIQRHPHILAACFGDGSRGHDHWAYLLEIACQPPETELAQSAVFGAETVSDSANASQGAPIRWSSSIHVTEIDRFLKRINFDVVRDCFSGFPEKRSFYKRRPDSSLEHCLHEMAGILKMYSIAAEHKLVVFSILD